MAKNGSTIITGASKVKLIFSWWVVSQSTIGNFSEIEWKIEVIPDSDNWNAFYAEASYTAQISDKSRKGGATLSGSYGDTYKIGGGIVVVMHNLDGTGSFNYSFNVNFGSSFIGSGSGTGVIDAIAVKAIMGTVPTSFTDEQNPEITFEAPDAYLGRKIQVCIGTAPSGSGTSTAIIPYRDTESRISHTFTLTDNERKLLRQYCADSKSKAVRFYIRTEYNGKYEYSTKTSTLNIVNDAPTLTPVIKDVNARTIELTGDSNKLIKYYSNAQITFGAAAKKEASIVDRRVINGSQTIEIEDSAQDTATINGIESNTFYLRARDSRGNEVEKSSVKSLVEYIKLTNNIGSATMTSTGTSSGTAKGKLTFTIRGKYFSGSFGAKKNTLEIEYGLRENGGDIVWQAVGTVSPTVYTADNTYSYTYTINDLNYLSTYELTVNAIDELTPVQASTKVVSAVPIFDWDKDDFKHHTNIHLDNNKTIRSYTADGADMQILGYNSNNATVLGWSGYDKSIGSTTIYGNYINLGSKKDIIIQAPVENQGKVNISGDYITLNGETGVMINGKSYGKNSLLWQGAYTMNASTTITLTEAISAQTNGIVLVFSLIRDGAVADASINSFFVSKKEVELLPDAPHTFLMAINAGFSNIGAKYLQISDTQIKGNATNTTTGTNSGITFNNNSYVLRYVIGV